jgi:hypothetical protein
MDLLAALQKGLEDECKKLHNGESVRITLSPQIDANTVQHIRNVIENLYRDMFQQDLRIEAMQRDEDGILHISVARNTD